MGVRAAPRAWSAEVLLTSRCRSSMGGVTDTQGQSGGGPAQAARSADLSARSPRQEPPRATQTRSASGGMARRHCGPRHGFPGAAATWGLTLQNWAIRGVGGVDSPRV